MTPPCHAAQSVSLVLRFHKRDPVTKEIANTVTGTEYCHEGAGTGAEWSEAGETMERFGTWEVLLSNDQRSTCLLWTLIFLVDRGLKATLLSSVWRCPYL